MRWAIALSMWPGSTEYVSTEFIRGVARVRGLKSTINYGANRIRYLTPVPSGARLRGRVRIAEAEDVPNGLRVTYGVTIELEGSSRHALPK